MFLYCLTALGQTGSLQGKIYNSSKEAISFAAIGIPNTSLSAVSDTSGFYIIENIPVGRHKIKTSQVGYLSKEVEIYVHESTKERLNIVMEEMENSSEEVVVTGTMQESYKMESVTPVEIYTPKFFQKSPTPNLFYALQMVNGVRPQLNCNVCNTGDIHINGMEGPYTMVMIDGMPIVSSLSTVYGLMGIPNGIVERIEVVKGPASTLYGSEAVAGVVNVITKNPTKAPFVYADVNATTWGEYNTDVSVKWKQGKAHSLLGLNYFNFKNRIDKNGDGFTDMTLQDRISVFNKWSFDRKENRIASIAFRLLYEDRFGGQMNYRNEDRGRDSIYGESIYTQRAEVIGAYQLPVKQNLVFYYSYNVHDQNSAYGTTWYLARQHVGFGQMVWTKILKKHNIVSGLAMRYTAYTDNTFASRDKIDSTKQIYTLTPLPGAFVQDDISITAKSKVLVGSRLDFHPIHGFIPTPRIGYKYQPNKSHSFRINTGNGFRVVNVFTEDHAALTGARKVEFVGAIKPEKSWNVNLNYTGFIPLRKGFINVDGSVFYNYFTNKIIPDYLTDPNKVIYKNLDGHAINKGVALSLDFSFTNSLKVQLAGTLLEAFKKDKDSTGQERKVTQLQTPNFQGNFVVSYTIPIINVMFDYTSQLYSPMKLPVYPNDYRPEFSPWFALHNIQASKTVKNVVCYMGIKNFLNFVPANPILRPFDPFDKKANDPVNNPNRYTFDPTYNYAPLQGMRFYMGVRLTIR
ncbi:MAG: TonB-dependent receptor [Opitutaceae bacterium]|nr:TonB-dependent receptor [Cytophagales bacterium]